LQERESFACSLFAALAAKLLTIPARFVSYSGRFRANPKSNFKSVAEFTFGLKECKPNEQI
jgi:hypothetical protein